ncbi:hypothetical protein CN134_27385 [Sinorhizobium meliloti]|nr:hypothetical protein CN134_27385 [Sinorhizobium meliloti]RVO24571.1 hypothetical protein CN098_28165 [Sinorhizobium meliloti]
MLASPDRVSRWTQARGNPGGRQRSRFDPKHSRSAPSTSCRYQVSPLSPTSPLPSHGLLTPFRRLGQWGMYRWYHLKDEIL